MNKKRYFKIGDNRSNSTSATLKLSSNQYNFLDIITKNFSRNGVYMIEISREEYYKINKDYGF